MAGLNIPKRSELPHGTFLGDVNKARLDAQGKLSDYAERASGVAGDMLFGEDTGEVMLKDLAYGLVPGGSLFQRAITGTRPGLLDFADFIPGGGVAKAMLPIAAKPTLDALKAGQRMGKTGRNLKKAQNPVVTRYHRTHIGNVPSIDEKGLLMSTDNYGRNTADSKDLPPMVWLSGRKDMIPVLRTKPDEQALYRVDIPVNEYWDSPRYKFKYGRGHSTADDIERVSGRGKMSVSSEGPYSIDAFGRDIPKEWLTHIDNVPEKSVSEFTDLAMMKPRSMAILSHMPDKERELLPSRFRNSIDGIVDESYDIGDDLGPMTAINNMAERPDKVELDSYLTQNISKPTLDNLADYMMEGGYYDENPADLLAERVLLHGGLVPYPGNGKRYSILDMSNFKVHEGAVSRGNDFGDGLVQDKYGFPTNAVKKPNWRYVSRPLSPEDREILKERFKKNYEYLTR